jgi:RNA polymerase sigma factor (sigma-70 family)
VADETRRLTTAMAAGDAAAVDAFYRGWFPFLLATARRATGRDEPFCLDVVQDATLRIVRTVRPADTDRQPRAWVRLVVQTTALDHLRRDRRRAGHEAAVAVAGPATDQDGDDDRLAWLREQVGRLDPELVRMIDLRYARGWTLRRIARALGLTVSAVHGRLRRALDELRDRAAEAFDE